MNLIRPIRQIDTKINVSTKYKYDQIDYISTMLNSIKTITDLRQDKYNTITIDQFKKKKKQIP